MHPTRLLLLVACAAGLLLALLLHQQLPGLIALHYGHRGVADSWGSRQLGLGIAMSGHLLFTGLMLAIPLLLTRTPLRWINFPNRDYWFSPERRATTVQQSAPWFFALGTLINLELMAFTWLNYDANRRQPPRLDESALWLIMGAFTALIVLWLLAFYRRFRHPV